MPRRSKPKQTKPKLSALEKERKALELKVFAYELWIEELLKEVGPELRKRPNIGPFREEDTKPKE